MERHFMDPVTGDIHPESHYQRENIDLATVLEVFEDNGVIGFDIRVDNIERMDVQHPAVFHVIAMFVITLQQMADETDDENERHALLSNAAFVSKVMLSKVQEVELH